MRHLATHRWGSSAVEAIQDAIEFESGWSTSLDGKSMTAAGAVILVSAHPDTVEKKRTEVLAELQKPDQFKMNERPYWRNGAQFIVTAEPNAEFDNDMYICLNVLSTGLEIT